MKNLGVRVKKEPEKKSTFLWAEERSGTKGEHPKRRLATNRFSRGLRCLVTETGA